MGPLATVPCALALAGAGAGLALVRFFRATARRRCEHLEVDCIHGDAILAAGGRRGRCRICGRLLPDLPALCSVTGRLHASKDPG